MATNFTLPPGRIISGSPTFKQEKDMSGRLKEKPNFWMAVAVPKTSPGVAEVMGLLFQIAQSGYAANQQVLQRISQGLGDQFSWKIDDGDSQKWQGKEGAAGCYIFKFSTTLGIMNCCDQNMQQIDAHAVKCGHWVEVSGNADVNGQQDHTAGLYLNPSWVKHFPGYGEEILSGPTPQQAFANSPQYQLPPEARPTQQQAAPQQGFPAPQQQGFPAPQPGFAQQQQPPQQQGGFPPPQQPPQQPQVGFTPAPAPGAPGPAGPAPAVSGAQPSPGTAFPSNQQFPGATPHGSFGTGGQQ